jgi:adenosylhomocysteine nucleosidase
VAFPPSALIGAGVAGGLSPALRPGAVVAAREVRADDGSAWPADAALLARAARGAVRVGVLVSCARLSPTAAEKAALLAHHPGAENAAADVESSGWARAAARAGIPFLALRAVVDAADEDLPESVRRAWGDHGVDRLRVVLRAIFRPREIPELLRLRRRTRRAMEAIAGILPSVLRAEA